MVRCMLPFLVMLALLVTPVSAAVSVTVSQSGADSGSVMGGETFTVTASGWSGSCSSAYLDLTNCPVCGVSESQSKTLGGSTVSWTTTTATKANSQSISVSVSGTCSPDAGSASFDVKNPPSLSAELSSESTSVAQGSTFSFNLNVQNSGETTARFGTITVSPSDFSISSGCSPSDIPGGQGAGMSCTVAASASAATGAKTVTLSINPANAGSVTKNMAVTVTATGGDPDDPPAVSPGGGGGGPSDNSKQERNVTGQISPPGLLNNTRLRAAIQNALTIGNMSENAIQNMLRLSNRISGESDVSRSMTVEGAQSRVKTTVRYTGSSTVRNYIMYEKIPKAFAESTDNITVSVVGARVEIVEKDPEYAIVFDTVSPNQELSVTYTIEKAVSTSTVDSFALEVYAESLGEEEVPVDSGDDGIVCAQVITPAKNPATGECREFSTPCDVPEGWVAVESCEQMEDNTLPDDPEGKTNPLYYVLILVVLVVAGYYLYPKIRDRRLYHSFNNI